MVRSVENISLTRVTKHKHFHKNLINKITIRGSSKVEEAVECYQRAANMFKMAKKWGSINKKIVLVNNI